MFRFTPETRIYQREGVEKVEYVFLSLYPFLFVQQLTIVRASTFKKIRFAAFVMYDLACFCGTSSETPNQEMVLMRGNSRFD